MHVITHFLKAVCLIDFRQKRANTFHMKPLELHNSTIIIQQPNCYIVIILYVNSQWMWWCEWIQLFSFVECKCSINLLECSFLFIYFFVIALFLKSIGLKRSCVMFTVAFTKCCLLLSTFFPPPLTNQCSPGLQNRFPIASLL